MPRNRPLIFTAFNSAAYFVMGLVISQRGPAFNDLLLISDTDVEGGSFYVTSCYLGNMLGSLLSGAIYGRIKTKTLIIGVMMTFSGVFTILVPWCSTFVTMLIIQCVVATCISAYETTIVTEENQAWDGSSQSAMQFLSFCFSLGGVFGPLITEPFMAPKTTNTNDSSVDSFIHISSSLENEDYSLNNTMINTSLDLLNANITLSNDLKSNLYIAYLITGASCIILSVAFYGASIKSHRKQTRKKEKVNVTSTGRKLPRKMYLGVLATMSSFYFSSSVAIFSFEQYVFYFVITHLDWSKENGAYLMSMFWALAMCLKLALIPIFRCVDDGIVLLFSVSGMVITLSLFSIAGLSIVLGSEEFRGLQHIYQTTVKVQGLANFLVETPGIAAEFQIHVLVWISTACYSLSHASVFAGGYAWVDKNLVKLDGKVTSVLMISAFLGGMVAPLPLGILMKEWSLMAFPYFVLSQAIVSASIFCIVMFVITPRLDRTYGPLRPAQVDIVIKMQDANETMIQNESLVNENASNSIGNNISI